MHSDPEKNLRDDMIEGYIWSKMAPGQGKVALRMALVALLLMLLVAGWAMYQMFVVPFPYPK